MSKELTQQMIADYLPFVKDPERHARLVEEDVRICGDVIRIEPFYVGDVLYEMRYYQSGDPDTPGWVLPIYEFLHPIE